MTATVSGAVLARFDPVDPVLFTDPYPVYRAFRLMVAEVTPSYYAGIGAEAHTGRQTRRAHLSAMLGRSAPPGLGLRDVTVVTVRLRPRRARALVVTLAALGYVVADTPDGTVLRGPDEQIRVTVGETGPEGVVALGLALNHPNPVRRAFGESSRLDGAAWTFHPCGRQT